MPMLSYAQNREDVILARVFRAETGFYVDVGAADPVNHSVTKWFYDRGWSGVNVEPQPAFFQMLVHGRPRDVNLNVAVSDGNGEGTFHEVENSIGCSTLEAGVAQTIRAGGAAISSYPIRTMTLERILETHADRPIDFLKIDVEGHEREVLLGFDLRKWRPRVLVVEATRPSSPEPSHRDWEPIVLARGYLYAYFDGLNRYYVRPEDESLIPKLAVAPNPFDDYVPYEQAWAIRDAAALRAQGEASRAVVESVRSECAAFRAEREELRSRNEQLRSHLAAGESHIEHLQTELAAVRAELARVLATTVNRATLDTAMAILTMTRDHLDSIRSTALTRAA